MDRERLELLEKTAKNTFSWGPDERDVRDALELFGRGEGPGDLSRTGPGLLRDRAGVRAMGVPASVYPGAAIARRTGIPGAIGRGLKSLGPRSGAAGSKLWKVPGALYGIPKALGATAAVGGWLASAPVATFLGGRKARRDQGETTASVWDQAYRDTYNQWRKERPTDLQIYKNYSHLLRTDPGDPRKPPPAYQDFMDDMSRRAGAWREVDQSAKGIWNVLGHQPAHTGARRFHEWARGDFNRQRQAAERTGNVLRDLAENPDHGEWGDYYRILGNVFQHSVARERHSPGTLRRTLLGVIKPFVDQGDLTPSEGADLYRNALLVFNTQFEGE